MRKILLLSADRAERGLIEPIMKELEKHTGNVLAHWCIFQNQNPNEIISQLGTKLFEFSPDIILVPTDRNEMVYASAYAYHNNFIVAHFHAGNLAGYPDEMNRRAISCFSHIMFCNTEKDKNNLIKMGEEFWRIYVVGSTAFDHIEIDESLCPYQPYDLVILHPDPASVEQTLLDMQKVIDTLLIKENLIIWLMPNKDRNYEVILSASDNFVDKAVFLRDEIRDINYHIMNFTKKRIGKIYDNLPRTLYLGLLKNCSRAIGNSSSFVYELPYLNPKAEVIQIGYRNKDRESPEQIILGGSAKIASILAEIDLESLRRKKFVLPNQ